MTEQQYQQLREVIIKANPDAFKETSKEWEESFYEDDWQCDTLTLTATEKEWIEEVTHFLPRHMDVYDWNLPYAEMILLINRRRRSITLADVLFAVMKVKETNDYMPNSEEEMWFGIKREGGFRWNLKDDNLDNQSDECKELLYQLLVKK